MRDRSGSYQIARALIDSGSQISAITTTCAKRLGLHWSWRTYYRVVQSSCYGCARACNCRVLLRFAPERVLTFDARVLPTITVYISRRPLDQSIKNKCSSLVLANPNFHISTPVDLLLDADLYATVMDGRRTVVNDSLPIAFGSCFGWVLIGPDPI